MFFFRPCPGEPGKVRYQIPSRLLSSTGRKGINSTTGNFPEIGRASCRERV